MMGKRLFSFFTASIMTLMLCDNLPPKMGVSLDTKAITTENNVIDIEKYYLKANNYNGHSYYIFSGVADTWEEAQDYCLARGGHLAVINDASENAYLFNFMQENGYDGAYFGYTDRITEGFWYWEYGDSSYVNWGEDEPNGDEYENYAMFYGAYPHGEWNDGDFYSGDAFICEWDYEDAKIAPGIQTFKGHSYYIFNNQCSTWEEARDFCESLGGYLAVINDNNENTALFSMVKRFGYKNVYFGYTDKDSEGVYKWVKNNSSTYENWGYGEPNGDEMENYAMFYQDQPTGQWNDGDFSENDFTVNSGRAFICEWDYAEPPVTYADGSYDLRYTGNLTNVQETIHFSRIYNFDNMASNYFTKYYQPQLAYVLSVMASSAYTICDIDYNLQSLGFEDYNFYNYYVSPVDPNYGEDNCAFSIAQKQNANGETIVLITVRGSYGGVGNWSNEHSDWNSNFEIWFPELYGYGTHEGFNAAMQKVLAQLKTDLGGRLLKSNVKYMITGHSRGAGIANLLAKEICDEGVSVYNVFDYNFACPDVAKKSFLSWNFNGSYDNIYNIGVAGDPVTVVPGVIGNVVSDGLSVIRPGHLHVPSVISQWGKYGKSYWFSRSWDYEAGQFMIDRHASENYVSIMSMEMSLNRAKNWQQMQLTEMKNDIFGASIRTNTIVSDLGNTVAKISDLDGNILAIVKGNDIEYSTSDEITVSSWVFDDEMNIIIDGRSDVNIEFSGIDDNDVDVVVVSSSNSSTQTDSVAFYESVPLDNNEIQLVISNNASKKENIALSNTVGNNFESIIPDYFKPSYRYGDINTDESINIADAVLLQKFLLGNGGLENSETADICRDGVIDAFDMVLMRRLLIEQ